MCSKWEKWLQGREREFKLKETPHRKKTKKQEAKESWDPGLSIERTPR